MAVVGEGLTGRRSVPWRLVLFGIAIAVFALDHVTKSLTVARLTLDDRLVLVPRLLWITHVENRGAAFSFSLFGPNVFLVLAIVASIGITIYVLTHRVSGGASVVLGLILGGTVGNGFDRLISGGSVTDMIEVPFWPVFNVADSAISVGVVLILVGYLIRPSST